MPDEFLTFKRVVDIDLCGGGAVCTKPLDGSRHRSSGYTPVSHPQGGTCATWGQSDTGAACFSASTYFDFSSIHYLINAPYHKGPLNRPV